MTELSWSRRTLKAMWESGVSADEIAVKTGYASGNTVNSTAHQMGLRPRMSTGRHRLIDPDAFRKLWLSDIRTGMIAYRTGLTNVHACAKSLGLPTKRTWVRHD